MKKYLNKLLASFLLLLPVVSFGQLPSTGVCVGSTIPLFDSISGGVWSSSNACATISGVGVVAGITVGTDTIKYIVSNGCGADTAMIIINVTPLPNAGSITGISTVLVGSFTNLSDTASSGVWSASNTNATVSGGFVTGITVGCDTISYSVSGVCGAASTIKIITINPIPNAGNINGSSNVCVGSVITLTDTLGIGSWSCTNSNATVSAGLVTGINAGIDTIRYVVANAGGNDTAMLVITINANPSKPVLNTNGPIVVCTGTLFQNYGTNIAAQAGIKYIWSTVNAVVWATGNNGQNALISFPDPGNALVILSANLIGTMCTSSDSTAVSVETAVAIIPEVFYFQYNFVCRPADLDAYQWGYDDIITLASTTIPGAINQDYLNANPDFENKYYWVNTIENGCLQKTYYNTPLAIQNINNTGLTEIVVYPNPTDEFINVRLNTTLVDEMQIDVVNITGQKFATTIAINNTATINMASSPAGFYIVNCYRNGIKIATARFIKK